MPVTHERSPLLSSRADDSFNDREVSVMHSECQKIQQTIMLSSPKLLEFGKDDEENPRAWPRKKKLANVAIIAFMASSSISLPTYNTTALLTMINSPQPTRKLYVHSGHPGNRR
jgi:hypothetical protein